MLALLQLELGVTAAVLVVQIFHFPLTREKKKAAQVNEFNKESFPLTQFLNYSLSHPKHMESFPNELL